MLPIYLIPYTPPKMLRYNLKKLEKNYMGLRHGAMQPAPQGLHTAHWLKSEGSQSAQRFSIYLSPTTGN